MLNIHKQSRKKDKKVWNCHQVAKLYRIERVGARVEFGTTTRYSSVVSLREASLGSLRIIPHNTILKSRQNVNVNQFTRLMFINHLRPIDLHFVIDCTINK